MGTVFWDFQLSVLEAVGFRELKQQTGIELAEYLQRVSVICSGRYRTLRYRECRKKSEIRKRKKKEKGRGLEGSMEKGEGWVREKYSKNFTEPGIGRNFHKFKNSVSTENLKNMLLKHITSEVSLNLQSDKGAISSGLSALYWRSSQYNKTRKRNKGCELQARRSMLNALLLLI